MRVLKRITDPNGKEVSLISIGRRERIAMIYSDDLEFLKRLGVSENWNLTAHDYVQCGGQNIPGGKLLIGRLLIDAGIGQALRYKDGNPLNLRRDNLKIVADKRGTRRDRNFVPRQNIISALEFA